jgi:hypothetical protein
MDAETARMVFTDPPYNVRVADIGNRGRTKHAEFAMASGEMTRAEYTEFLTACFQGMAGVSVAGAVHFICTDAKHLGEMTALPKPSTARTSPWWCGTRTPGAWAAFTVTSTN